MNKPVFYVGDEVTVVDRGSERFVITKTPAYTGGSYTLTGAFDDTLEMLTKVEYLTLYKASPYRPVNVQAQAMAETKRAERKRIDALLDAKSSFIALYDSLESGPMRDLIGDLRDEADRKLRTELAQ